MNKPLDHGHLEGMKMKPLFALILTLATLGLAACGGGGGGSSSGGSGSASPTPVAPASTTPDTSEPAPTYTSGDPRLVIYSALNDYRSKMAVGDVGGVGLVGQNGDLDTAAQAHAVYLTSSESVPFEQHNETAGTDYYADTPYARAAKAGFSPASAWIGEAIGDSGSCVSELLDTVYHLQALTSNIEQIGIGYTPSWVCVIDAATITGTAGSTLPANGNGEPIGGGQQLPSGAVAMSPYNGETGVLPAMNAAENPRPVPTVSNPGHPVMLRVRADFTTDTLLASSFTLTTNGSPVSGTVLVASNASASTASGLSVDPLVAPGVAFFVPNQPLQSGTTYTASFSGSRNGVALSPTWSFTTQ